MNMAIPVYLFTGFLESGKTRVIKETLKDEGFNDGEKTLLIVCEEGEEEYDEQFLLDTNTIIHYVENEEDLNFDLYQMLDKKYEPDRVMIEFNGTWSVQNYLEIEYPMEWILVQILSVVDSTTFPTYISNMRSIMYDQLCASEVIVFNRCDENTKKSYIRTNVKAINKRSQIIYESVDGSINSLQDDELPFDITKEELVIEDDDYGLWYMDALDHPEKYQGKTVHIHASVIPVDMKMHDAFILGRYSMVCCEDDTAPIAFICVTPAAKNLKAGDWVQVEAKVEVEYDESYGGNVPVLFAKEVKPGEIIENDLVYFS